MSFEVEKQNDIVGQRKRLEDGLAQKVPKSAVKSTPLYVCISRICSKFSYTCEKEHKTQVTKRVGSLVYSMLLCILIRKNFFSKYKITPRYIRPQY